MKSTIFVSILGLIATLVLQGCGATNTTTAKYTDEEVDSLSWSAFCRCRGYKLNDYSDKAVTEYLDAWMGTVDEEESLDSLGTARRWE